MSSNRERQLARAPQGFTIIEILITTFLIGTVVVGLFGLFVLELRSAQTTERRVVAIALANERMEMVRNLPYESVGTSGGVPSGSILQLEQVERNGVPYTVETDIRYVDDPFDGVGGDADPTKVTICHKPPGNPGGQQTMQIPTSALNGHLSHGDDEGPCSGDVDPEGNDLVNTDYKQVRVEVGWPSQQSVQPILLITHIAPQGVEESALNGTLDFQALNAAGEPVVEATVTLVNDAVDPAVNVTSQTDANGRVLLPGLEPNDQYELHVTKSGYTEEQTYDVTADFVPDADHSHLVMIAREITPKTFFIDLVSAVNMTVQDESEAAVPGLEYTWRGTKTFGSDGEENPVYFVDETVTTSGTGTAAHENLVWDTYDVTLDGVATGYDIKEVSPPLPLALAPGETIAMTVTVVTHTDTSLQVTVTDLDGAPVDNATLRITPFGPNEELGTGELGQVYFGNLPGNDDYSVEVSAPGFTSTIETVSVAGTTRIVITLSSA